MGKDTTEQAADIIAFVATQEKQTMSFRKALDDVIPYYTMTYFDIPNRQKTDDYEIINSNKPRIFSDKISDELAYGILNHKILLDDSDKPLRDKEALTEQAVYAFDKMADEHMQSPFSPVSLKQLAWFIANTGFVAARYLMYEDEDGVVIPDLAMWDIRFTYWALGKGGRFSKVCYTRQATKDEIDDEYNIDATADHNGMVTVYDHWKRSKTAITRKKKTFYPFVEQVVVGTEIVHELNIKKDYLPVYIASVGNMPMLGRETDLMGQLPKTFASHNKDIWKLESELATYRAKNTRMSILQVVQLIYDSRLGGDNAQIQLDKSPHKEGAAIHIDVGKGQAIKPFFQPMSNPDAAVLENEIAQWESMGAAPDISYGRVSKDLTAQGTAMLIHQAMGVLKAGQRTIEDFKTWQDNESIRQYKEGEFKEIQIEGVDGKGKQFSTKITRDSVTTDRRVIATLSLNTPQDDLQQAGIIHQYVQDGTWSQQRGMDKSGVQDVDAEKEIIAREKLEKAVPFAFMATLDALIKDKDPQKQQYAMILMKMIKDEVNKMMMQGQQEQNAEIGRTQPQPNQPGIVAAPNPAANINPPEVRNMMVKPGQNNPKR